jgi:hypothetical protein
MGIEWWDIKIAYVVSDLWVSHRHALPAYIQQIQGLNIACSHSSTCSGKQSRDVTDA